MFSCVKVLHLDYIKSYLPVVHHIIVWFYYHLLKTKNSSILTKSHFGIFRYFCSTREDSVKKSGIAELFCLQWSLTLVISYDLKKLFKFKKWPSTFFFRKPSFKWHIEILLKLNRSFQKLIWDSRYLIWIKDSWSR